MTQSFPFILQLGRIISPHVWYWYCISEIQIGRWEVQDSHIQIKLKYITASASRLTAQLHATIGQHYAL